MHLVYAEYIMVRNGERERERERVMNFYREKLMTAPPPDTDFRCTDSAR